MRLMLLFAAMLMLGGGLQAQQPQGFSSGPAVGEPLGPFDVVKIAGATDDGVNDGETLCYFCKYGTSPAVMIFTRETDATLVSLLEQLDEVVANSPGGKLKAFVNVLGTEQDAADRQAKELAQKARLDHVAVVVPQEFRSGPEGYGINPEAATTVILYRDGRVASTTAVKTGLTPETRDAILENLGTLVD